MPDRLAAVTLDAVLRAIVADVVRDEVARALAPIVKRLDALSAAAPPATIDIATYAERNGVAVATARRWAAAGKLRGAVRVGRGWRVDVRQAAPVTDERIAELAQEARAR